jgi:hypothetical protein
MNESVDNVFEIYDFVEQSIFSTWSGIIAVGFFAVAGLCIVVLLGWFIREKLRRYLTPAEQSLQDLALLNIPSGDISLEQSERFYCDLIVITKTFLSINFGLQLKGKTDVEVVSLLQTDKRFEKFVGLPGVFSGCQTIKFAAGTARIEQMNHDKSCVADIVGKIVQDAQKQK